MRQISFLFAFAVIFLGPSTAGQADKALPGVGTFAFPTGQAATFAGQVTLVR